MNEISHAALLQAPLAHEVVFLPLSLCFNAFTHLSPITHSHTFLATDPLLIETFN